MMVMLVVVMMVMKMKMVIMVMNILPPTAAVSTIHDLYACVCM